MIKMIFKTHYFNKTMNMMIFIILFLLLNIFQLIKMYNYKNYILMVIHGITILCITTVIIDFLTYFIQGYNM